MHLIGIPTRPGARPLAIAVTAVAFSVAAWATGTPKPAVPPLHADASAAHPKTREDKAQAVKKADRNPKSNVGNPKSEIRNPKSPPASSQPDRWVHVAEQRVAPDAESGTRL